jgi:hypothetical protein
MPLDFQPRDMSLWDPWFAVHNGEVHLFCQQGRLAAESDRDPTDADCIGHAVSTDLMIWTEREPILRPDPAYPLEDLWAWTGCAVSHEDLLYVYYTMRSSRENGQVERLGLATSPDGKSWTRHPGNPILEPDPRWYRGERNALVPGRIDCRDLSVVNDPESGDWYGFYATRANFGEMPQTSVIGAARSRDLVTWEPLPPAFAPGTYGTVEVPEVFPLDGRWYLTCLTGSTHGNWVPWSDPYVQSGTMYAVADRPEGPYRELPADNTLLAGTPPCPHSCRSVLFEGERYVLSTQESEQGNTLSPPMLARALPGGALRLAYSPRTQSLRRRSLTGEELPRIRSHVLPLGHWCPLLSGAWETHEDGYRGASATGWQTCDLGVGAREVEIEATVRLHAGRGAGLVYRPDGGSRHPNGDIVAGVDAAEGTAFIGSLPSLFERQRRVADVGVDRAHHLRLSVRLPRLELYVDDLLAVQCAVGGRETPSASVGLYVDRGEVTVTDLAAWELG